MYIMKLIMILNKDSDNNNTDHSTIKILSNRWEGDTGSKIRTTSHLFTSSHELSTNSPNLSNEDVNNKTMIHLGCQEVDSSGLLTISLEIWEVSGDIFN